MAQPAGRPVVDDMDLPFPGHHHEIDGLRIHCVDEGRGRPLLLLHGNPTWSYLYRRMIPPLVEAGYRCVAPDLMGFGLSDKPEDERAYSLERHVRIVTALVERLGLVDVVLVGHDWGGPIGLAWAIRNRDRVRALVLLDTFVAPIEHLPWAFRTLFGRGRLSSFLVRRLDLFRAAAFGFGFRRRLELGAAEMYRMPHPDAASRAGIAAFPKMIPTDDDHPNAAALLEIEAALRVWDLPSLVVWADRDVAFPVEAGKKVADTLVDGRFHVVARSGHFLQEDAGPEIVERTVAFLDRIGA